MAVIDESADDVGISEIHAELYAGKCEAGAIPEGDVHYVTQERLVHRSAVNFLQQKMDLMDVKRVQLLRAILDDPVFYVPQSNGQIGRGGRRIVGRGFLSVNGEHENRGTVGIVWV